MVIPQSHSIVIATFQRPEALSVALASIAAQTRPPQRVVVVDGASDCSAKAVVERFAASLPVEWMRSERPSAAVQRNQGADRVTTPLLAFMDDDAEAPPDFFEKLCIPFDDDTAGAIGGISGRMAGSTHPRPRGLLWLYYRLQAGYSDATYGARLFGPAINCFPCYEEQRDTLIPADWLNTACVVYRTELFKAERFPAFDGYSYMEDAHLSARIAKKHRLFFHSQAIFEHHSSESAMKANKAELARQRIRNQRLLACEVLGVGGPTLSIKMLFSRIFSTVYLLRRRAPGWTEEIHGTWSA